IAWCGWQWDVEPGIGLMLLRPPLALEDGRPIAGEVSVQFQPLETVPVRQLGHSLGGAIHKPYAAAEIDDPTAVLTVRDGTDAPRPSSSHARSGGSRGRKMGAR